jgi:outer membrane receptor protein involved in Fe transport
VDARISDELRLLGNYSYIDLRTNEKSVENRDTNIPRNMGRIQLSYTSAGGFMFDASGTYTDKLKVVFVSDPRIVHEIDDYWRLDLRVAQRFQTKYGDITVGAVGSDLGQDWHEEYANFAQEDDPYSIRRAYYGFIEISENKGR